MSRKFAFTVNETARSARQCSFKDNFYEIEEEFYDSCEYKCRCNQVAEITCEARCLHKIDQSVRDDPMCTISEDPSDSCCEVAVCARQAELEEMAGSAEHKKPSKGNCSPSLTKKWFRSTSDLPPSIFSATKLIPVFEGCIYKNKTHKTGDVFYDGCSSRCECGGYGAISCVSRCPLVHEPGPQCSLQPDPEDSCCKILVCNVPDDAKLHKVKGRYVFSELVSAEFRRGTDLLCRDENRADSVVGRIVCVCGGVRKTMLLPRWSKAANLVYA